MAQNLAGGVAIGQLNACIVRVARLGADCHPTGGANSGVVTAALATLTADPEIEEGTVFEPKNGCGTIAYTYRQEDRIKRYNISGEFLFFDYELMELIFGGTLILGAAGGPFAGKVIGYGDRPFNAVKRNGIYLEVITEATTADAGDCVQSGAAATPAAVGHVFGKCRLIPGSRTFENDVARVAFTGIAENNPWLTNGPWNDFPGAGYALNTPYQQFEYGTTQYAAIQAAVTAGGYAANLPTGS